MLGDFINRCLILILGYAYPGFECYKTVEKNKVDIEELRFWCKYWIIVALFSVLEKFTDIFISWLPMYGEIKLALFVYMWYPKTRGSGFIYETVLRPYMSKHEKDIDRTIQECKARGWDYFLSYWQNFAQFGHSAFITALQQLASQSSKIYSKPTTAKNEEQSGSVGKNKKRPTNPPSSPSSAIPRQTSAHVDSQTESEESEWEPESVTMEDAQESVSVKDRISSARARLRKLDSNSPRTPRSPITPSRRQS